MAADEIGRSFAQGKKNRGWLPPHINFALRGSSLSPRLFVLYLQAFCQLLIALLSRPNCHLGQRPTRQTRLISEGYTFLAYYVRFSSWLMWSEGGRAYVLVRTQDLGWPASRPRFAWTRPPADSPTAHQPAVRFFTTHETFMIVHKSRGKLWDGSTILLYSHLLSSFSPVVWTLLSNFVTD